MITDQEFLRISAWLKSHYGIDMGKKKVVMNGRLENYIRKNGYKSFGAFMDALEADKSGKLERMLVNLLTTNHTFFMREFEHFEYFRSVVLPWLSEKESVKKDLRIWCGASSTGEEPYMIAMVLLDFFGTQHRFWDTKVLATDISTKVLRQALEGVYTAEQLSNVPEKWKRQILIAAPWSLLLDWRNMKDRSCRNTIRTRNLSGVSGGTFWLMVKQQSG